MMVATFPAGNFQMSIGPKALFIRHHAVSAEVSGLFEQFRDPLFRYLLSFGLSVADCEEVIQETFLALFRHLAKGGARDHLRGWVFRVGHNLALKTRQRQSRDVPMNGLAKLRRHPDPDPEQQAVTAQWQDQMAAVFRAMPEQDRACLSLRAEGFRYREIAGILGVSLGWVAQSMERSLGKLTRASALHEARR